MNIKLVSIVEEKLFMILSVLNIGMWHQINKANANLTSNYALKRYT